MCNKKIKNILTKRYISTYNVYKGNRKRGENMNQKKSEILERVAGKFTQLDEETKDKVAWYMLGKEEERAKWEKKLLSA